MTREDLSSQPTLEPPPIQTYKALTQPLLNDSRARWFPTSSLYLVLIFRKFKWSINICWEK